MKKLADDSRAKARNSFDGAIISALVATGSHTAEHLHQLSSAVTSTKPSSFISGANGFLKWFGVVSGVFALIAWFTRSSEAIKAETQLQMLGPEEIKYAGNDHAINTPAALSAAYSLSDGKHCTRLNQEAEKQEVANYPTRKL